MKQRLALIACHVGIAAMAVPAMAQDRGLFRSVGCRRRRLRHQQGRQFAARRDQHPTGQNAEGAVLRRCRSAMMPTWATSWSARKAELTNSTADSDYGNPYTTFGLGTSMPGATSMSAARVGYKLSPTTMLYAKGGYTNARFNYVGTDGTTQLRAAISTPMASASARASSSKFGSMAFGKLEYRYSNYSKGEIDFEAAGHCRQRPVQHRHRSPPGRSQRRRSLLIRAQRSQNGGPGSDPRPVFVGLADTGAADCRRIHRGGDAVEAVAVGKAAARAVGRRNVIARPSASRRQWPRLPAGQVPRHRHRRRSARSAARSSSSDRRGLFASSRDRRKWTCPRTPCFGQVATSA